MTAGFDVGAERPARPTITQLREVTQPPSVRSRAAAEHWVAHAYLRDISPYLTRILLRGGFSANGVTWLMIIAAAAAAVATSALVAVTPGGWSVGGRGGPARGR